MQASSHSQHWARTSLSQAERCATSMPIARREVHTRRCWLLLEECFYRDWRSLDGKVQPSASTINKANYCIQRLNPPLRMGEKTPENLARKDGERLFQQHQSMESFSPIAPRP